MVVTISQKDYNGKWTYLTAKRKKAAKLYEDNKIDIIGEHIKTVKYGNKSNMGFRFGENQEIIKKNKTEIRQYAVDFNGTRELIKTF